MWWPAREAISDQWQGSEKQRTKMQSKKQKMKKIETR